MHIFALHPLLHTAVPWPLLHCSSSSDALSVQSLRCNAPVGYLPAIKLLAPGQEDGRHLDCNRPVMTAIWLFPMDSVPFFSGSSGIFRRLSACSCPARRGVVSRCSSWSACWPSGKTCAAVRLELPGERFRDETGTRAETTSEHGYLAASRLVGMHLQSRKSLRLEFASACGAIRNASSVAVLHDRLRPAKRVFASFRIQSLRCTWPSFRQ